ncbi:MAG: hypothetical protein WBP81_11080 [Solirubrobacteraceae bacterium]
MDSFDAGQRAWEAGKHPEAAELLREAAETPKEDDGSASAAAYQLGCLLSTAGSAGRTAGIGYALWLIGQGPNVDLRALPYGPRVRHRHPAQRLFGGPVSVVPAGWDPVRRTVTLSPAWVVSWLESFLGQGPHSPEDVAMARFAAFVSVQMNVRALGPEELPPSSAKLTGYLAYLSRSGKVWEDGLSQVATERHWPELARQLRLTEIDSTIASAAGGHPLDMRLYPEEASAVSQALQRAFSSGVDVVELERQLVAAVPDTRSEIIEQALGASALAELNPAIEAVWRRESPTSPADAAIAIGYSQFSDADDELPPAPEAVNRALRALAVPLALATTLDEVGVVLGQGSSLHTLSCLATALTDTA